MKRSFLPNRNKNTLQVQLVEKTLSSGILQLKQSAPESARPTIEQQFGGDISGVRVHTDLKPMAMNQVNPSSNCFAPPIVKDMIHSPGQPLDKGIRDEMEFRFGHDFSHVRVYADTRAGETTQLLGARAYTIGNNIAFGPGEFAPVTGKGKQLLAHELTHVIQQDGMPRPAGPILVSPVPALEAEAEAATNKANVAIHGKSLYGVQCANKNNPGKSRLPRWSTMVTRGGNIIIQIAGIPVLSIRKGASTPLTSTVKIFTFVHPQPGGNKFSAVLSVMIPEDASLLPIPATNIRKITGLGISLKMRITKHSVVIKNDRRVLGSRILHSWSVSVDRSPKPAPKPRRRRRKRTRRKRGLLPRARRKPIEKRVTPKPPSTASKSRQYKVRQKPGLKRETPTPPTPIAEPPVQDSPPEPLSLYQSLDPSKLYIDELRDEINSIRQWLDTYQESSEERERLKEALERLETELRNLQKPMEPPLLSDIDPGEEDDSLEDLFFNFPPVETRDPIEMAPATRPDFESFTFEKLQLPKSIQRHINKTVKLSHLTYIIREEGIDIFFHDGGHLYIDMSRRPLDYMALHMKVTKQREEAERRRNKWYHFLLRLFASRPSIDSLVKEHAKWELSDRLFIVRELNKGHKWEDVQRRLRKSYGILLKVLVSSADIVLLISSAGLFPASPAPRYRSPRLRRPSPGALPKQAPPSPKPQTSRTPKGAGGPTKAPRGRLVKKPPKPLSRRGGTRQLPVPKRKPRLGPRRSKVFLPKRGFYNRVISEAQESLKRAGLTGRWITRISNARPVLIRFINRFHNVPGFEEVVKDYLRGRTKRIGAEYVMRVARSLSRKYPGAKDMSFEVPRIWKWRPTRGRPSRVVDIKIGGIRHELKSWQRLYTERITWQFIKDLAHYGPDKIRWIFDAKIGRTKASIIRSIERILRTHPVYGHPGSGKKWILEKAVRNLRKIVDVM